MLFNKKILFFGGSGSLGNTFISTFIKDNNIVVYSRDECKHWEMNLRYNSKNLSFIIGDIRDKERVENSIINEDPHIIIIASALKHIDKCEYNTNESLLTNVTGTMNILNCIERYQKSLTRLECVTFISTDKACEPTNVYGMCKALSESALVEKSLYVKHVKFVNVRYGNVLNSRGSIIPILHEIGQDINRDCFNLTHEDMTRFVMTLDESIQLIVHAIIHGESGDTVIPSLSSMRLKDLFEIFSEKYNKPIKLSGLRFGEKMHEALISEVQSYRTVKDSETGYFFIKAPYKGRLSFEGVMNYNSSQDIASKEELKSILKKNNLL